MHKANRCQLLGRSGWFENGRSGYFVSPGTNRRGHERVLRERAPSCVAAKQFAATGVATEGESTGDWCHAEAAARINVIGCRDDCSAGAEPSVCRCWPRRGRGG